MSNTGALRGVLFGFLYVQFYLNYFLYADHGENWEVDTWKNVGFLPPTTLLPLRSHLMITVMCSILFIFIFHANHRENWEVETWRIWIFPPSYQSVCVKIKMVDHRSLSELPFLVKVNISWWILHLGERLLIWKAHYHLQWYYVVFLSFFWLRLDDLG